MNNSLKALFLLLAVVATTMYFELKSHIEIWFSIPESISSDIAIHLLYCILFAITFIVFTGRVLKGAIVPIPLVLALTLGPVAHFHFDISSTIVNTITILGIMLSAVLFYHVKD